MKATGMPRFTLVAHLVTALLTAALVLWVMAFLYFFRVTPLFLRVGKWIGTETQLAIMLLGPLVAALLGLLLLRSRAAPRLGWLAVFVGLSVSVAGFVMVGAPWLERRFSADDFSGPLPQRPLPPDAGLPVFPNAEGYDTRTRAGRDGKVLFVTSLADSGPGTLREALQQSFPRIILFRTGGTIELKGPLFIKHPFVTVAGQTALGDGILIRNAGLCIMTHDVLVQHLRVRPGNEGRVDADTNDALTILNRRRGIDDVYNVVVDHCSFSWGEDETVSTWYAARDITISWCIISEALNRSRHRKGRHGAGLLVGDGTDRVTLHHNLLAHNDFRNPLLTGGGTHDFVNNLVYDWGRIAAEIQDHQKAGSLVNFVGNQYLAGPSTESRSFEVVLEGDANAGSPKLYTAQNLSPTKPSLDADDWAIVSAGWSGQAAARAFRAEQPASVPTVTRAPTGELRDLVLAGAGATRPQREAVDARIVKEVRAESGHIINSPQEVGGYPKMKSGTPPADSDGDGLPDDWELRAGLNPNDAADGNRDRDGDGYTNIEEYLNSLAAKGLDDASGA